MPKRRERHGAAVPIGTNVFDTIPRPSRPTNLSPALAERRDVYNQFGLGGVTGIGDNPNSVEHTLEQYGGLVGGGTTEVGGPVVKSLGKALAELLGLEVRPTAAGSSLPKRLRLTNATREGDIEFHAAGKAGQRFNATPRQFDTLIDQGALDIPQPPAKDVAATRKKISRDLDRAK